MPLIKKENVTKTKTFENILMLTVRYRELENTEWSRVGLEVLLLLLIRKQRSEIIIET